MPHVSAKRKALLEINRVKGLKRQRIRREELKGHVEEPAVPLPKVSLQPHLPSSPPNTPHVSAASFTHSLLPNELRETEHVNNTSASVTLSLERLRAVLDFCDLCRMWQEMCPKLPHATLTAHLPLDVWIVQ